jgi:hypothetical protein
MKIKINIGYLFAFLSLLFLAQEWHDWAHCIVARFLCGCWGSKGFNDWTICNYCSASLHAQVLIWFADPLASYILIWLSWWLMRRGNLIRLQSLGFSLLFAAVPFVKIMAALAGGGDETNGLRQLFQHADGSNRHAVALTGLCIVLLLTIPALIRAFILLRRPIEKLILFPIFLVLPLFILRWGLDDGMKKISLNDFFSEEIFTGTPVAIIAWAFFLVIVLLLTYKNILNFFSLPRKNNFTK